MIKNLIFDLDGVLINTEPLHYEAFAEAFRREGLELPYEIYRPSIGSTNAYVIENVEKALNKSLEKYVPALLKGFRVCKAEILKEKGVPRIDGVEDTIRKLYEDGYKLAVASSSSMEEIENELTEIGIYKYFTTICSGKEVANPKPAPDVFLKAIAELGADKAETVVIEDSKNGSLAAKSAGVLCFGFVNYDSGDQDLSAADWTFDSYEQLIPQIKKYE